MPAGELIRSVNLVITLKTERGLVRATQNLGLGSLAYVALYLHFCVVFFSAPRLILSRSKGVEDLKAAGFGFSV